MKNSVFLKITLILEVLLLPFTVKIAFLNYKLGLKLIFFIVINAGIIVSFAYMICDIVARNIFKSLSEFEVIYENNRRKLASYISMILFFLVYIMFIFVYPKFPIITLMMVWFTTSLTHMNSISIYKNDVAVLIGLNIIYLDSIIEINEEKSRWGFAIINIVTKNRNFKLSLDREISSLLKSKIDK